ncbi:hypothetical protein [Streptomyces sp. NPDC096030]|uniref:hypothetical protein n=1 Tax=Streptomyces sp. NPDC096030 TaxID=3155423 RepID=UPI00331F924B
MSGDTWTAVSTVVAAVVSAGAAAWSGRAARRTRRDHRRDDFTVIRDSLNDRIEKLETAAVTQQEQITGQGAAISWLVTDRHGLVGLIRRSGLEPPAPRPIPVRARPYLDHIDV